MSYAEGTSVSVERSQREIEELVTRKGARSFARALHAGMAIIAFELEDRRIQFDLPMPTENEFLTFERRGRKVRAAPHQVEQLLEQARRSRWRALALAIKAKLVSIEAGVESFEEAFLAQIVVPGGGRFAKTALPAIASAYKTGRLPPLFGQDLPPLLPSGKT